MAEYTITTAPTETPISLAEAKEFLRRGSVTADDNIITRLIESAVQNAERYTNRHFVERTILGEFDELLSGSEIYPYVELRRSPFNTLISVSTIQNGTPVVIDSSTYKVKKRNGYTRILFSEIPVADSDDPYPIQVSFKSGYGAAADVHEDIKQALLNHVNFLYENRGDVVAENGISFPPEVRKFYKQIRVSMTYG